MLILVLKNSDKLFLDSAKVLAVPVICDAVRIMSK